MRSQVLCGPTIYFLLSLFVVLGTTVCSATDAPFCLIGADSGSQVFPNVDGGCGSSGSTDDIGQVLKLAKNEREGFQVTIRALETIKNVTWTFSWGVSAAGPGSSGEGRGAAGVGASDLEAQVNVVGYAKQVKAPSAPYPAKSQEWFPSPLLDFMNTIEQLDEGKQQPLWVVITAKPTCSAGHLMGTLTVHAENAAGHHFSRSSSVNVTVFAFQVPDQHHLPSVWGDTESSYTSYYGHDILPKVKDLLVSHRLPINDLYSAQSGGAPVGPPPFNTNGSLAWPSLDAHGLRQLRNQGQRFWNLGYLNADTPKRAGMSMEEFLPHFCKMLASSVGLVLEAGWPTNETAVYVFDETKDLPTLKSTVQYIRGCIPNDTRVMTTARDLSFGVETGVDISVPHSDTYTNNEDAIALARSGGKEVWWYVSCCASSWSGIMLDFFIQYPPIRSRLLMGVAAWKYQVDGFLYYRLNGWMQYNHTVISTGPNTEWLPYGGGRFPDGDGELVSPGLGGPLSSTQLQNVRDGLEDYEYLYSLNTLVAQAKAKGIDVSEEEALLHVPDDVLTSIAVFSDDPLHLRHYREAVASAIESVMSKLTSLAPFVEGELTEFPANLGVGDQTQWLLVGLGVAGVIAVGSGIVAYRKKRETDVNQSFDFSDYLAIRGP